MVQAYRWADLYMPLEHRNDIIGKDGTVRDNIDYDIIMIQNWSKRGKG